MHIEESQKENVQKRWWVGCTTLLFHQLIRTIWIKFSIHSKECYFSIMRVVKVNSWYRRVNLPAKLRWEMKSFPAIYWGQITRWGPLETKTISLKTLAHLVMLKVKAVLSRYNWNQLNMTKLRIHSSPLHLSLTHSPSFQKKGRLQAYSSIWKPRTRNRNLSS